MTNTPQILFLKTNYFIFDKTYTCPVCDKGFKTKTVKTGKVKLISADTDLRPKYQHMDSLKYGGSAGGVAAAMKAYLGAQLVSGISYFLETVNFEKATAKSDLILTAEGKLDEQTLEGKGPFGVATTAMKNGIPVVFLTGQMPAQISAKLHKYFNVIIPVGHGPSTIEEAIHNTSTDLQRTAFELGKLLSLQNNWKNK